MLTLYPPITPHATHHLQVDDIHNIYIEESGNPKGVPILYLHGGPGTGTSPSSRQFFDPKKYRIILFDQRGCGLSKPHGEIKNNTSYDLVEDMEKIREHLNIQNWIIFGGSWGSTLALIYAQLHPRKVLGLILRGIFLGRKKDLDWFYKDGASRIYPDHWNDFIKNISEKNIKSENKNYIQAYYEILTGKNEIAKMAAAKAWSKWEAVCSTLEPSNKIIKFYTDPKIALARSIIETHYFANNIFLKENDILNNMNKISHIPGIIIHGRYDLVCPIDNAFALKNAWEKSELIIIREAGHSASEPGMVNALIKATNKFIR